MMETMTCISGIVVVPVVVGAVVAVWSMRRMRMRITMTTTVGTIALVFAAAMIMMMAAIRGQAGAILIVTIAAG